MSLRLCHRPGARVYLLAPYQKRIDIHVETPQVEYEKLTAPHVAEALQYRARGDVG